MLVPKGKNNGFLLLFLLFRLWLGWVRNSLITH